MTNTHIVATQQEAQVLATTSEEITAIVTTGENKGQIITVEAKNDATQGIGRVFYADEETLLAVSEKAEQDAPIVLCDIKRQSTNYIQAPLPVIIVDKARNAHFSGILEAVEHRLKVSEVEALYAAELIHADLEKLAADFRAAHPNEPLKVVAFKIANLHRLESFDIAKNISFSSPKYTPNRSVPINIHQQCTIRHQDVTYHLK